MCTGVDKKVFSFSSVSSSLVTFKCRVFPNQRPNVCNNYPFLKIVCQVVGFILKLCIPVSGDSNIRKYLLYVCVITEPSVQDMSYIQVPLSWQHFQVHVKKLNFLTFV